MPGPSDAALDLAWSYSKGAACHWGLEFRVYMSRILQRIDNQFFHSFQSWCLYVLVLLSRRLPTLNLGPLYWDHPTGWIHHFVWWTWPRPEPEETWILNDWDNLFPTTLKKVEKRSCIYVQRLNYTCQPLRGVRFQKWMSVRAVNITDMCWRNMRETYHIWSVWDQLLVPYCHLRDVLRGDHSVDPRRQDHFVGTLEECSHVRWPYIEILTLRQSLHNPHVWLYIPCYTCTKCPHTVACLFLISTIQWLDMSKNSHDQIDYFALIVHGVPSNS